MINFNPIDRIILSGDLENTKESILPVCDINPLHKIKENLPHWEELEKLPNGALSLRAP